jgi:hypothetical protein
MIGVARVVHDPNEQKGFGMPTYKVNTLTLDNERWL